MAPPPRSTAPPPRSTASPLLSIATPHPSTKLTGRMDALLQWDRTYLQACSLAPALICSPPRLTFPHDHPAWTAMTSSTPRILHSCPLHPGMAISPLKAPPPSSSMVEKQQNHKSYSTFHNLTEDYRGNFQSCFHFGENYRAEQNINTHTAADPHSFNTHTHNGLHAGSNTGFSLVPDQFSFSADDSVFFQLGAFERSLSQMSSVYTET